MKPYTLPVEKEPSPALEPIKSIDDVDTAQPGEYQDHGADDANEFEPSAASDRPFVIDEVLRVIRPLGQKSVLPQTYGFALWRDEVVQTLATGGQISPRAAIVLVQGSGGAVTLTSNPNITAGVKGQLLILEGQNNTNTLALTNGNGVKLSGAITLGLNDTIFLYFNGTNWLEVARSNN